MRRLALVLLPTFGFVGAVFYITVLAPPFLAAQHFPLRPEQPIHFDHEAHVQELGLDCAFCHRTANVADSAGIPDVQQCMFCHNVVDLRNTARSGGMVEAAQEVESLRRAWMSQRPINWVRVHRLPDHTQFPHQAHVQMGVPCATCHGSVETMTTAEQVRPLKMTDCVECHQDAGAPTTCGACHY